jgi:hypothetical protein
MKIIKRGEPSEAWPREWETPCCKSTLEIEPGDILRNTDYTGSFSSYFVNCPVCGQQPDVPHHWKHEGDRWREAQEGKS